MIFLYSFSICSLLLYRKATDFYRLILYLESFLKLFMMSRSFLGPFGIKSCHLEKEWLLLTTFFPVCIPFISSCLIAIARNSTTMLNKSGESGHPVLFLTLKKWVQYDVGYRLVMYSLYHVEIHPVDQDFKTQVFGQHLTSKLQHI
jgi:hypothetical protein